ncbi:hypothetical protein [Streptomyces lanatus]|uniref:SWIM-type domain-containing protein n=1 Tax=Streptomyces lanatus TaxID=66900 RepID=A0ABV1XKB0_9ACTN|nr:hypothetical protein [Streptomyces lanatus]GHG95784.1 hypothetical protein GCM10018780_19620 [Streptomyces lanatus]
MTVRADLLALTPQTLASLANRGLVKRAEKDLTAGSGPEVTVTDDGTVRGRFPDGTDTALPPGLGLDASECACGATSVCRHRIGLVLAYQRIATDAAQDDSRAATDAPRTAVDTPGSTTTPFTDWSPAEFDDDALTAVLGRAALLAARRTKERGYLARLHRPTPDDPEPRVELPTCTVRFPVPHELGYALTDASTALRGEVVTLAVWAFRAADGQATEVSVGGRAATTERADAALRTALALADDLLLDGVQQAGPVFAGSLVRAQESLTAASLHWPAWAVAELREQIDAYAARGTRYEAERFALLLAELHARHRAAGQDPVGVLGTKEAPETPLRRVRLVALGCRIGGTAGDRTAETYFAHAEAGLALVLRKRWDLTEDRSPTGHDLAARRMLGSPLRDLATANVVSEHTARAADRTVTISRGRIAATSVTPLGSAWRDLPGSLLVRDTAAHLRAAGARPPRLIRPRVEAESVRVVEVAAVESIGYDPATQRLEAVVRDTAGNDVLVGAEYNPLCPGGLDALAAALDEPEVYGVSGMLGRAHGRIVLNPLAVLTSKGVTVPDLAPGAGDTALGTAPPRLSDPITTALTSALTALAQAAHQGLRHLNPPARTHLTDSATALRRTGLHTAARLVDALGTTLRRDGATAAAAAWVDAQIHLAVSLELHAEGESNWPPSPHSW